MMRDMKGKATGGSSEPPVALPRVSSDPTLMKMHRFSGPICTFTREIQAVTISMQTPSKMPPHGREDRRHINPECRQRPVPVTAG